MTTVEFTSFDMADTNEAVTIEEVFRKWSSLAGIQAFSFDDQIANFNAAKWTTISNVAYGDTLARTGTVASDTISWFSDDMPHTYQVEFTTHQPKWTILLRGFPGGTPTYYRLDYDHDAALVTISYKGTVSTQIFTQKVLSGQSLTSWGRVKIMVRDQWGAADNDLLLQYISLWIDDVLIVTNSVNIAGAGTGLKMGFMVYAGSAATLFSGLRVSNLTDIAPTSSLDPAGTPLSAIQLAVEDRYVRWWIRWDGSLRAWTPTARANSLTITRSKQFALSPMVDIRQLYTHIRVLGAFAWVQLKDDDLVRWYGHRFKEIQNSSMWFADDCYRAGQQMLIRAKEQAFQAQFSTYGMLLCEIEDRVQLPDIGSPTGYVDYIIDNLSWQYINGTFSVSGTGRQYFYGEPDA